MGYQKQNKAINLSDFEISDDGRVCNCPKGNTPIRSKKNKNRHTAMFDSKKCENCPIKSNCCVKQGKKYHYLRYSDKDLRLSIRKKYEQTDIFKERYRWRAGVEATMSELDRRTGIKHLRVRGINAVRLSAILKAVGLNILRAAAAEVAENNSKYAFFLINFALLTLIIAEKVFFKNFQRSKMCC